MALDIDIKLELVTNIKLNCLCLIRTIYRYSNSLPTTTITIETKIDAILIKRYSLSLVYLIQYTF